MFKRVLLAAVILALLVPMAFAQTLKLATGEDWENLDPAYAGAVQTGAIVSKLYDGLMRYSYESTDVVPNLAERFEANDEATEFTFYLRKDVKFHDGTPFTASDVKYSFERVLNPDTGSSLGWVFADALITGARELAAGEAAEVSGIEVIDDHTTRMRGDGPDSLLLHRLSMPAAHVVREQIASELGEDLSSNPVGTGPFIFESRGRDSNLVLKANKDYFAGAPKI